MKAELELPHSETDEQGVIGSCLVSRDAIARCSLVVTPAYFYTPAHQTIYQAMLDLHATKTPIDLITFTQQLRSRKVLEAVGGAVYITHLFNVVPTDSNLGYYLRTVVEQYKLRQAYAACKECELRILTKSVDLPEVEKKLGETIRVITESRRNESITHATALELLEMVDDRELGGGLSVATGIQAWDDSLKGIFPRRFYVIGARPKIGKTALIEQIAQYQAIQLGVPVLIFQRDMGVRDLLGRMACRDAGVIYELFVTGKATDAELRRIRTSIHRLNNDKLRIYSPDNMTAKEMAAIIEREIRDYGIKVFYLDLFQRLKTGKDKVEELTDAANIIRDVIQTHGISGVILAEILKEADKTGQPHSGQFKYCDGLFSSCDTSIMMWSRDDPKQLIDTDGTTRRQQVHFTVDANRAGGLSDDVMHFDRPMMTFYPVEL